MQEGDIPNFQNKIGSDVTIIFVDRWGNGGVRYEYHPIRRGKLIKCVKNDPYAYFYVELEDFVYTSDLAQFSCKLPTELRNILPTLQKDASGQPDPINENDGIYATDGNDVITDSKIIQTGREYSTEAIEAISKTRSFNPPGIEVIFLRSSVDGYRTINKKAEDTASTIEIPIDGIMKIDIDYIYPEQSKNPTHGATVEVSPTTDVVILSSKEQKVDSHIDTFNYGMIPKSRTDETQGSFHIIYKSNQQGKQILGPDASIQFVFTDKFRNTKVYLLILLYALASWGATTDVTKPLGDSFKVACNFSQAIVLYFLLRMTGKKIL
jgi:hypothetical protein